VTPHLPERDLLDTAHAHVEVRARMGFAGRIMEDGSRRECIATFREYVMRRESIAMSGSMKS